MTSELVPLAKTERRATVKDLVITLLTLCLCFSLAALIYETRKHQEFFKLYSEQWETTQAMQRTIDRSSAEAAQNKTQGDRALRRAQLAMKASTGAWNIALRLRQADAGKSAAR